MWKLYKYVFLKEVYFILFSAWNSVSRELDMCHNQPHSNSANYRNGASVTYYQEREPNPHLKGKHFVFLVLSESNKKSWWFSS